MTFSTIYAYLLAAGHSEERFEEDIGRRIALRFIFTHPPDSSSGVPFAKGRRRDIWRFVDSLTWEGADAGKGNVVSDACDGNCAFRKIRNTTLSKNTRAMTSPQSTR